MNVLVLHSRLSGYFNACLRALADSGDVHLDVYAKNAGVDAPFSNAVVGDQFNVVNIDQIDSARLRRLALETKPDLVLLSGWWNRNYLEIATHFRAKGIPVTMSMDNQWTGNLLQRVRLPLLRRRIRDAASCIWIPGQPQYRLAQALGFSPEQIFTGFYTCDIDVFRKEESVPKARGFLFVGRFVSEKGISTLLSAYEAYRDTCESPWPLTCVGAGPLEQLIRQSPFVEHIPFVQPVDLPDLLHSARAFVMPSEFEPWGVAIHEAAATGLPLICSDRCGAAYHLLRNHWNGFVFESRNTSELARCLNSISDLNPDVLRSWGARSEELAKMYTAQDWTAQVWSMLDHDWVPRSTSGSGAASLRGTG